MPYGVERKDERSDITAYIISSRRAKRAGGAKGITVSSKSNLVTKSNATRDRLKHLRDNLSLKWEDIAAMPEFNHPKRIPQQTLYMIYAGERDVPKKFRKQLGEPETAPAPVCTNPNCEGYGEPHVYDCRTQAVKKKAKPRRVTKWRDLGPEDLRWALDNRHPARWGI